MRKGMKHYVPKRNYRFADNNVHTVFWGRDGLMNGVFVCVCD